MIKKLHRDYCIIKFRNLPLQYYDKETNSDAFYTPKHKGFYWIKLPDSKKDNSKQLINELIKLIGNLKINHLIFLDEIRALDFKVCSRTNQLQKTNKSFGVF
ncbi:MAG: hypothetical protein Q4G16_05790 [Cruoricaptor ignavus]|nr:hypothetical protein [Cruoricaptor ignavus]